MTVKSEHAQRLVSDPELQEAFACVREKYRDLIETTPLDSKDSASLHDIRKMLHLLKEVEQHLHRAVQDGHLKDIQLQHEQEGHGFLGEIRWLKPRQKTGRSMP